MEATVEQPQPDRPLPTATSLPPTNGDSVPVSAAFHAAARLVRRLSRGAPRQVRLAERGGEAVKLHPIVLGPATDAVERLVGGAALNEIECPAERSQAGKLPAGRIGLAAYEHTGAVVIEVTDDGRGRAADALQHFDAVAAARAAVESVGGTLAITSIASVGTTFTLRLPPGSAVVETLIVRIGDARYAVPRSAVLQILPRRAAGWRAAAWFGRLLRRAEARARHGRAVTLIFRGGAGGGGGRLAADEVVGREHVILGRESGTARLRGGAVLPVLDGRTPQRTNQHTFRIKAA